jgi:uncharacterized protein (DUF1697 family)
MSKKQEKALEEEIKNLFKEIFGEEIKISVSKISKDQAKEIIKEANTIKEEEKALEYYIHKVAERKGWKLEKADGWLLSINEISPVAAFTILLKEIAIDLDKNYEGHIKNSEQIYAISTINGKIFEVDKAAVKSYNTFAAFRTYEDAQKAIDILAGPYRELFFNE